VTRVAAVDCGTNSLRLLVAERAADGRVVELTRRTEIVRLGEGVDRTGRLAPEALRRTAVVLADYAGTCRALSVSALRMVATSATRDAANQGEFATLVRGVLGVEPDVISGTEEAELSFAGALAKLPELPGPCLVVDIGGGSTEFVLGRVDRTSSSGASTVDASVSVDLGCVRLTERYLRGDPPPPSEVDTALAEVRRGMAQAADTVPLRAAATFVGLAGTVTTIAALALDLPAYDRARIHHARIPYEQVAAVTGRLLAMTRRERAALPVMHPGRADVIAAGALILREAMAATGRDEVVVSEHDLLDGIVGALLCRPA